MSRSIFATVSYNQEGKHCRKGKLKVSEGISNDNQTYTCLVCGKTRKDNGKWCLYCGCPHEFESEQHRQQWEIEHDISDFPDNVIICSCCGKFRSRIVKGMCRDCYQQKYARGYVRRRRGVDTNYRIGGNLRARLNIALRGKDKLTPTMNLVGCGTQELRDHLESQFTEGMTWDNYGEWHIDHVVPMSIFDLTDENQLKTVMHYTNLQPLWASDNIRKSNKHEGYVQLRMV